MAAPKFRIDDAGPIVSARRPPRHSLLTSLRTHGLLLDGSAPVDIAAMDDPAPSGPAEVGSTVENTDSNAFARWANGVTFEGDPCGDAGGLYDPCEGGTKTITDSGGAVEIAAVTAQSAVACTALTRGGIPDSDVARARRLLNVEQHRFIGSEVWRGTLTDSLSLGNSWLANPTGLCQIADGDPVPVVDGLAALEEALYGNGDCGCVPAGQGMIHVDPYTLTLWESEYTIVEDTVGFLRTRLGTIVVTGPGYDGSSPAGTVGETNRWAYATGLMFGGLTPVKMLDPNFREMDRSNNQVPVYAERVVVVGWDECCRVGVNINLLCRAPSSCPEVA